MRQFAKSALSFGCALSLLGAKQAYSLMAEGKAASEDVLAPVTQAAVGQLDGSLKNIHRTADRLESQAVDLAFCLMNSARWLSPRSWNLRSSADRSHPANDPAPDRAGGTESQPSVSDSPASEGNSSEEDNSSTGWGPMPGNLP
jgi:hypothetical protein